MGGALSYRKVFLVGLFFGASSLVMHELVHVGQFLVSGYVFHRPFVVGSLFDPLSWRVRFVVGAPSFLVLGMELSAYLAQLVYVLVLLFKLDRSEWFWSWLFE